VSQIAGFKNIELKKVVEKLLGRKPKVAFTVRTFCPDGTPQVLMTEPCFLEEGLWKPFPTIFWLVCPRLRLKISQLEQNHEITRIKSQLGSNQEFLRIFQEGQENFSKFRMDRLNEIFPQGVPLVLRKSLEKTTVVGSRDFFGVKCLHAHVAQELGFGKNPIGKLVLGIVGKCEISSGCGKIFERGE
jgi:hypothetical protein